MPRRIVIVLLQPVPWTPPGVDPGQWRAALAEDAVDLLATLAAADGGLAAPPGARLLAEAVAWPGMPVYDVPAGTATAALDAAAGDGRAAYDQAAVLAPDAPDLPGLVLGKLLRPLSSRSVAVAPATGGGLLGVACRLPAPAWLPPVDLDRASPAALRAAAPDPAELAEAPGWRRVRGPDGLAALDPALEGWAATRTLLAGRR